MAWSKLDDRYHDNPKMVAAGLTATGLHARAITYSARHETNGHIPVAWVDSQIAELRPVERRRVMAVLEELELFERCNGGYVVHDYLDFNPSRAELEARREADKRRKGNRADS